MPKPRLRRRILFSAAALAIVVGLLVFAYLSQPRLTDPTQLAQANQLLTSPHPQPKFVTHVKPEPGYNGPFAGPVCFNILDGPPLVTKTDTNHIPQNTRFIIDSLPAGNPVSEWNLLLLMWGTDDEGNPAAFGGPWEICYDLHLGVGLHTASIEIKAVSGKTYSYQWAFNIQSTDPALYSAVLTATSDTFLATYAVTQTASSNYWATCTAAKSCPTTVFEITYTPSPTP